MTKINNPCDKTQNSNCDKIQQHKLWQKSKSRLGQAQDLKLLQNSKTWFVTKFQTLNCDKLNTQIEKKIKNYNGDKIQKLKL